MFFRNEFDELFRSGRSVWLKILGGASVAGISTLGTIIMSRRNQPQPDSKSDFIILVAITCSGGLLGASLSLKDVVRRRIAEGRSVNPILRLYFGMQGLSLAAWCITTIAVTIAVLFAVYS